MSVLNVVCPLENYFIMCMGILPQYMYIYYMAAWFPGRPEEEDPLELKLHMVVNVVTGN